MAVKRKDAMLKGMTGDIYTRVLNTSNFNTKHCNTELVLGHYGSKEYRKENDSDYTREVVSVKYTKEEHEIISKINHDALKRLENYKNAEDC